MRSNLHHIGILALVLAGVSAPIQTADAQEEGERRILKLRQSQDVNLSDEYLVKAREKRLESIQFLKELIAEQGSALKGDRKAEMMLRLADLYFQQGRDEYLVEMAMFDKEYDKCFNTEGCDPGRLQPDNEESQKWQNRSIKLYKNILQNYPRYSRADEATFYLGQALSDIGRRDDGKDYFENLVRMYPDSQFVPDTYVNLGEYYFDNDNAYKALTNYKKATAYRDHDKYGFSLYKLAWCYYNVGEAGKSIETMKAVVSFSMAEGAAGGSKLQLQEEALKDLVRFFADAGELDEAYEYFNKLGKKELIRSMLKQLAKKYFDNGKWEEAIQTYRRLIAENPTAPENPDYQHEIIQAYQKMGLKEETFTEIDRMLKTYGKDSAWARANASNQEAIEEATQKVEKNLRQVALYHHNRAKKIKSGDEAKQSYALAYKAYKVYLREFPGSDKAYEIHYSFAELLYKIKKYEEAYEQYMAVVDLDPKGKHSEFCAESAIFAADEMVKKEGGNQEISKGPGEAKEAQPLTDWEKRLVDACAKYADLFPGQDKVKNIIYKSGYLLYNKYRFEEAADQFNKVISSDPGSREAEQAANLILDSFVVNEDWANLQKNAKIYYDTERLGSATFKKEVYGVYQNASLKLIEVDFEANKNHTKTAAAYVQFYNDFPDSDENARILNNATIYFHKDNQIEKAMEVRRILVDDPKFGTKTKYYYDQIGGLGYDHETIADYTRAAELYEEMFGIFNDPRKFKDEWKKEGDDLATQKQGAADAIYSAAVFRKALGEWKPAIENYKKFLAAFPEDDRANDIKLTIGKIYEENEQWSSAANVFKNFYETEERNKETTAPIEFLYFARLHHARALEKQNQTTNATRLYEATVDRYNKYIEAGGEPGGHTEFVAEMMFKLAEPQFEKYAAAVIGGVRPGSSRKSEDKQLGDALKKKAELLVETEKVYAEIIKTGAGEWGLAGLVKLGEVYENMAKSLEDSHIPSYLTEDQVEMYTMALEDKVYPQQEKAVAAYKAALDKSYELTLYNDNTALATRRLGELRPNDFPGLQEELPEVRETSSQTRSSTFETNYK